MPIDDADRAGKERHRHEHRHQYQRDADDGAGDLPHRLAGGVARRESFLGHNTLDILHHDDRVVDQDADGEHHAEKREYVDGEAEQQKNAAGAKQRYRHDDGRNDRVADVLQEQEHHQEHQHHGLRHRGQHLLDRSHDNRRNVVGDVVFDIRREKLRQRLHPRLDGRRGRQRIGLGREQHRKSSDRLAIAARGELITQAADFDPRHVAEPHGRAVRIGPQNDGTELLGRRELALDQHQCRDLLVRFARFDADAAGGDLCVLRADGFGDVVGSQPKSDQPRRVDPYAQRAFGGVQRGATDAGNAPYLT